MKFTGSCYTLTYRCPVFVYTFHINQISWYVLLHFIKSGFTVATNTPFERIFSISKYVYFPKIYQYLDSLSIYAIILDPGLSEGVLCNHPYMSVRPSVCPLVRL